MNPAIKALADQARQKAAQAKAILAKADATPEEIKTANDLTDEAEGLQQQAERAAGSAAKLAAFDQWDNEPANALPQPGADAGKNNFAGKTYVDLMTGEVQEEGKGVLSTSQLKAVIDPNYVKYFPDLLRAGGNISKVKSVDARKFLSEGIDEDGGITVPPTTIAGILRREPTPVRILDYVRTVTVGSDKAQMLRSVYNTDDLYSSSVRVYPTGEGAAATETDKPQFGTFAIDVHSFTAELVITRQLLEDTNFDLMSFITEEFRTAVRNHTAQKVLSGSGVAEHFGILTRVGSGDNNVQFVKSGHASQVTWAGLRQLKNAVPEQYDIGSNYMFNKKSTQDAIEALVDGQSRPLWPESQRSGMENGVPGRLNGYGYIREAFMPDVAASAYPILFGDFRGYIRAMRLGMTIESLREIEARSGKVVMLCRFRDGGDVAEPWRIRAQKIAA